MIITIERSRIIFYSSITLAVISGQGKKFQPIQFLRAKHEDATPVFSHLHQQIKGDKDFHSFQIYKAENCL